MTTYMKHMVGSEQNVYRPRGFSLMALFKTFTRSKAHVELIDSLSETAPVQLPQELEEKIRLFRQKHFKD